MPHQSFNRLAEDLAEDYSVAEEAMTGAVIAALEGRVSHTDAERIMTDLAGELKIRANAWVEVVLPAVQMGGIDDAHLALGAPISDADASPGGADHKLALHLAQEDLRDSLGNSVDQMVRDARHQMRAGVRLSLEEAGSEF